MQPRPRQATARRARTTPDELLLLAFWPCDGNLRPHPLGGSHEASRAAPAAAAHLSSPGTTTGSARAPEPGCRVGDPAGRSFAGGLGGSPRDLPRSRAERIESNSVL